MADIQYSNIWPGIRSGISLPDGQRIDYHFDRRTRLSGIALNGDSLTHIERDALGREVAREQGDLVTATEYDPSGLQWVFICINCIIAPTLCWDTGEYPDAHRLAGSPCDNLKALERCLVRDCPRPEPTTFLLAN